MNWQYTEADPAMMLFTAARERFGLQMPEGAKVLELGCAETDFLERLKQQNPSLAVVGIDWRQDREPGAGVAIARGNAAAWNAVPSLASLLAMRGGAGIIEVVERDGVLQSAHPANADGGAIFDAVILLGALEHFGLGYYGDPVDDDGDTKTMENVVRWLKPGGWVYFDVPMQPEYRVADNRHFRMYSPAAVTERLIVPGLVERARVYSEPEPHAGVLVDEPTLPRVPYWYVAVHAQRPHA